ncbi:hypothetical protein NDU88_005704 [Pleurodeles waltl]|uniref:Uncharacterized protein n=1 Tax=Pleurodeles waltl TaxID=8319 RepID=A0AAV7TV35_PLEWA|nr:hypothetical protein NDU88_005704 [Pleurodeles waltl]
MPQLQNAHKSDTLRGGEGKEAAGLTYLNRKAGARQSPRDGAMLYSPIHINDELRSYYIILYSELPPAEVDALHVYLEGLHLRTLVAQDSEQLGAPVDVQEVQMAIRALGLTAFPQNFTKDL